MSADFATNAVRHAVVRRGNPKGIIMHSDKGSQYTSSHYQDYLESVGMIGSMCGKGNCYDNARMERFNGSLKDFCVVGENLKTPKEMAPILASWMELDYNAGYPHSSLSYLTPIRYEEAFYARQAA